MANVVAVFLYLVGIVSTGLGALVLSKTGSERFPSAIHEIEGLLCFVSAAVCVGCATIEVALRERTAVLENELRALHMLSAEAGQRDLQRVIAGQRAEG